VHAHARTCVYAWRNKIYSERSYGAVGGLVSMEKATTALFRIQRLPAATRRCERTQRVRDDVAVAVAVAVAVGGGEGRRRYGPEIALWARVNYPRDDHPA